MNIFSQRPPSEFEDQVECFLYFSFPSNTNENQKIEYLEEMSALVSVDLEAFVADYIWQRNPLVSKLLKIETVRLQYPPQKGLGNAFDSLVTLLDPGYPFLYSKTSIGDCIDDEWFIVFLLRRLTLTFQDLVIRVFDNDGEFLLIEAAMQIPRWLDPSNSDNRVFIYRGALHIIPIPKTPAEIALFPAGKLTTATAVELVRNCILETEGSRDVQQAAFARTLEFSEDVSSRIHRARCHIPIAIAQILKRNPRLVAPAVEMFYTRDPMLMKACYKMERFAPSTSVTVTVKFTKTLYAQLMGQRFHPPRPFKLPPVSSKEFKSAELGMKLACGFEMLCAQNRGGDDAKVTLIKYPFDSDPTWINYLDRLTKRGLFDLTQPGSERYNRLMGIVKEQYLRNRIWKSPQDIPSPVNEINELLTLPPIPTEVLMDDTSEDDDSWINIDIDQLDAMLSSRNVNAHEEKQSKNEPIDISEMVDKFSKFVDFEQAGVEGAEFLDEQFSDSSDDDHISDNDDGVGRTKFDPADYQRIMKETLHELGISQDVYREWVKAKKGASQRHKGKQVKVLMPVEEPLTSPFSTEESDDELAAYMEAMDHELSSTKLSKSFISSLDEDGEGSKGDGSVDINLNLVKNMLESFKEQQGLPGPAGNILGRLGVGPIPRDELESDEETEL